MSTGFQELRSEQLTDALAATLLPNLMKILQEREVGHCMRVTHLEQAVMQKLVIDLRNELKRSQALAEVYILGNEVIDPQQPDLFITSTKLVELRNPLPDQSLRVPLLVFLPRDLQTNAEDSFNIASFEDIPVDSVYRDLTQRLLQELPLNFQGFIREALGKLSRERWRWANPINQARYLLTARINGFDGDTLGASLYELGLIPDFHLFDDPSLVQNRLLKNRDTVKKLIEDSNLTLRGRVLSLRLLDPQIRDRLIQLLLATESDNPSQWTKQIVLDKQNWELEFTKWERQEDIDAGKIQIEVKSIDLPVANETSTDSRLLSLIGSQYLAAKDHKKLRGDVQMTSSHVTGLAYFTVQIISLTAGGIGIPKKIKAGRSFKSFTLDKLDKIEFDEGWHFVRVLAWTEAGTQIPIESLQKDSGNPRPNESEVFYILPDGELEEEAVPITTTDVSSFSHLNLQLQLNAIANNQPLTENSIGQPIWVETNSSKKSSQEALEIRCGKNGKFRIAISSHLKQIESEILKNPQKAGLWQQHKSSSDLSFTLQEWTINYCSEKFKVFLAARKTYFEHFTSEKFSHIAQSVNWLELEQPCLEYATTYNEWLNELKQGIESNSDNKYQLLQDLRQALAMDAVHLKLGNILDDFQEVILVGPTHPLRALWFLNWAKISQSWIDLSLDSAHQLSASTYDSIQFINPTNIPAFHPLEDGRIFTAIENLTPFWSIYAPPQTSDIQGLIVQICQSLEIPQSSRQGSSNITSKLLATKICRYLAQHPYIQKLVINIFNLSRANLLADVLLFLKNQDWPGDLRFEVRLFSAKSNSIAIEECIETLSQVFTNDSNSLTSQFVSPNPNSSLFPRFSLSIHQNIDFANSPENYSSHISLLFDVFSMATIEVLPEFKPTDNISFYGLAQDFVIQFKQDDTGTRWSRQPRCGTARPIPAIEPLLQCFNHTRTTTIESIATVAAGTPAFNKRPTVTLSLEPKDQKFIHQIHHASDWVFTIDRNLGIEFFDQDMSKDTPVYLVDYVPDKNAGLGHQLLVTSQALTELETILSKLLISKGLQVNQKQCAIILNQLRSLSGRLALKLISSSSHQAEVLGLALARLFLASQGALKNQAILPIDTHIDLFQTAQRQADKQGEHLDLQRTDLALFHLSPQTRTIKFNLVEVKCYSHIKSISDFQKLKDEITKQLDSTEAVLRHHFDYQAKPDQYWKANELSNLLTFYLSRAERYQLISAKFVQEAQDLLSTLEEGYELQFSRSALIFDFNQEQPHFVEYESATEFHHIGRELIKELVEDTDYYQSLVTGSVAAPKSISFPSLGSAAFIVPQQKDTTVTRTNAPISSAPELPLVAADPPSAPAPSKLCSSEPPSPPYKDIVSELEDPSTLVKPLDNVSTNSCKFDVMLGVQQTSPQFGIIGEVSGRKIALDLSEPKTISLFGVQGAGKSYTLGTIIEMACAAIPGINVLPSPLATVVFHYSPTEDYKPEFTSMLFPNDEVKQLEILQERYGVKPASLEDIVILTPTAKLENRQAEYPNITVLPISFSSSELRPAHWKFLMGAVGSQSLYLRQINQIMKSLQNQMSLDGIRQGIENSSLADHLKNLARTRLSFASEYIDDTRSLSEIIKPGRLIIVDLRDELIDKDEALGLFVVMLQLFSGVSSNNQPFNKLVVLDEAHKYMQNPELVSGLIEVVREMRHKGTSILIASQDPASVPISLIELSSQMILHRFNSPAWLKHVQKAVTVLNSLTPEKMSSLDSGEAYIWSSKATDNGFTKAAIKIRCRPRVTLHGGGTKKVH